MKRFAVTQMNLRRCGCWICRVMRGAPLTYAANELPAGMRGMIGAVNVALIDAEGAGNAEGQELTLADQWFQVSPYGEWDNEVGVQVFDREAANEIVTNFHSLSQTVGRNFRGLPIWIGHPDFQPKEYPDKKRYGSIVDLEARDNGLFAQPKWNGIGREAVNDGHFIYQSPYWGMREIAGTGPKKTFRPALLESVGLTNNPNIPGLPVGASNEKTTTADPNQISPMTKEALIKKFSLKPLDGATEVTDAQIEAAVDGTLNAVANGNAARTKLVTTLGLKPLAGAADVTDDQIVNTYTGLRTDVTAATDVRDTTLVESAVNEGKITAAEKPAWMTRLKTDFASVSAVLKGLTPAVNTRAGAALTAELGARDKGATGAASAGENFTKAVNERMATTKEDFPTAWEATKKTHKSIYDQMQQPKGL